MKTGKVYLNINESDLSVMKSGLIFYFSSEFYQNKFMENVDNYINDEILKIQNKYKINCSFEIYLMLSYYKKIEKRGFKVFDDVNKKYLSPNVSLINAILTY